MSYDMLLSPITINQMELSNRVIMAPTVDHLASEDGFVTPRQKDFILKRAKGGISMIVVGGIAVNPRNYPFVLRIHDDKYLPGLRDLVATIHSETNTKVGAQLWDWLKIGRGFRQDVNEVPIEQIERTLDFYEAGAIKAREVGFDAIEIHAAHGYTLAAFLSLRNNRKDEYGGSLQGRMRLVIEVYERIRNAVGPDYPIGIRMCGDEFIIRGNTLHQTRIIAKNLAEKGMDYLSISAGGRYEDSQGIIEKWGCPHHYPPIGGYSGYRTMPPIWMPEAVNVYLAEDIRATVRKAGFNIPVITAGRIPHPELAEEILQNGKADIIGLCRPLLRDPEWLIKAKEGRSQEIDKCVYCNTCLANECEDEPAVCIYRADED